VCQSGVGFSVQASSSNTLPARITLNDIPCTLLVREPTGPDEVAFPGHTVELHVSLAQCVGWGGVGSTPKMEPSKRVTGTLIQRDQLLTEVLLHLTVLLTYKLWLWEF